MIPVTVHVSSYRSVSLFDALTVGNDISDNRCSIMKNIKEIIALICCCNLVFPVPMAMAAPQGGKVVGGSAHIHQSGATTTINQSSNRAVINWNSFDIGKNETVRHNMPSANSAGLHRVVGGGGASQIMGQLQSNGNVYLVNPAGVVIHKGARIDANSFTATSRDISNDNFMKGNMVFDKPGRPDAEVINQGTISVKENGLAALVAPTVRNDGVIAGKLAKVALASGDSTWKLDMHGDDLITFTVDEKDVDTLHAVDGTPLAGVENSGSIKAEGGVVVLTAAQLDGIVGSVVNSGEVSAASAELKGGKIVFKGAGSGVDIVNTGTVDASSAVADGGSVRMDTDGKVRSSGLIAATGGQKGGKVVVTGKDVALTGKAKIDVSGNKGGGTALVGGNALGKGPERNAQTTKVEKDATIVADARTKGDGGQVVVWSDEKTNFDGTITARGGSDGGNGGKVETSGKSLKVGDSARVDTRASKGIHGQWLLDPMDFVIAASGGDMSGSELSAMLEKTNIEIKVTDDGSIGNGDIFVNDNITWSASTNLKFQSLRDIWVNSEIKTSGNNSELCFNAQRDIILNNNIYINGNNSSLIIEPNMGEYKIYAGRVIMSGESPYLSIYRNTYKVIQSAQELMDIPFGIYSYYALGKDIDFRQENIDGNIHPIGYSNNINSADVFSEFDGLGNSIINFNLQTKDYAPGFTQEGDTTYLSGCASPFCNFRQISNLTIKNAYIKVNKGFPVVFASLLTASNSGIIKNVHVDGIIDLEDASIHTAGLSAINYGEIINSSSSSKITLSAKNNYSTNLGGIVATNLGKIKSSSCYADIDLGWYNSSSSAHTNAIGGFVGEAGGEIYDSYAIGSIKGYTQGYPGAFVGELSGKIYNSYSAMKIDSNTSNVCGGFAGLVYSSDTIISNCYWDHSICDLDKGIYIMVWGEKDFDIISLSTEQMHKQSSFKGWDFNNIWIIDEGSSYPLLRVANAHKMPDPDPGTDPGTDPDPTPTPEIPTPVKEPDPLYIKDDKTYWIMKDGDRITTNRDGNNVVIRNDEEFVIPDDTIFVVYIDSDDKNNNTHLEVDKDINSGDSKDKLDINHGLNESPEDRINRLVREIKNSVDQSMDSLYDELYGLLRESIENVESASDNALKNIKDQLKFTPLSFGTSKNLPDGVYEAIAEAIFDAMGASKVEKYSDDLNEFNRQLYSMVKNGSLNKNYITKIDGVTYTINLQGFLYGGVGFSGNSVKWKDTKNKIHSGYVYWASSPSEAMAAISEYCVAVSKINTKAWKEAASYFLTGTPNSKIVDFGSKIVEALCDTNAGKALAETIGTEFKKEYKSGFFGLGNTFKEFVKQLPGGEKIIKVAETISKTKDACANLVDNINNFKNNFDKLGDGTNDIVDMVDLLNNNYNFSTMEINNLSRKMQELDNAISQAKTEKLNDLPEYKRQTVDEIYAEHNQRQ